MAGSWIGTAVGGAAGVIVVSMVDGTGKYHLALGAAVGAAIGYYLLGLLGVP